jgi:hypothetical protein
MLRHHLPDLKHQEVSIFEFSSGRKGRRERRHKGAEQATRGTPIKKLSKPSSETGEDSVKLAATVIKREMGNGLEAAQKGIYKKCLISSGSG